MAKDDNIYTIVDVPSVEDVVYSIHEKFQEMLDQLENNEPLQAKQSLTEIDAMFDAIKEYVNVQ